MKPKHRRLIGICGGLVCMAGGLWILSQTMRSFIVYYVTPSELLEHPPAHHKTIRLGGQVMHHSLQSSDKGHHFLVSDGLQTIMVRYEGLLPSLFREGQGVVAEGSWDPSPPHLSAQRLLVKHDEYYRPPSTASTPYERALKARDKRSKA